MLVNFSENLKFCLLAETPRQQLVLHLFQLDLANGIAKIVAAKHEAPVSGEPRKFVEREGFLRKVWMCEPCQGPSKPVEHLLYPRAGAS